LPIAALRSPALWMILFVAALSPSPGGFAEEIRRVAGAVVDAGGRPISGAEVILRGRTAAGERRASSDEAGRFEFEVPAGAYLIEAHVGGARSALRALDTADAAASIELRVDRAAYDEQVVVTA